MPKKTKKASSKPSKPAAKKTPPPAKKAPLKVKKKEKPARAANARLLGVHANTMTRLLAQLRREQSEAEDVDLDF